MSRPGQGTKDTRRRATFAELGEAARSVIDKLVDARLVVVGRDETTKTETVEGGPRGPHRQPLQDKLRVWMDAERVFRTWQERLRGALRQSEASGHDDDALLGGALLAEAERWLEAREADLGPAERSYIRAGVARRERARDR